MIRAQRRLPLAAASLLLASLHAAAQAQTDTQHDTLPTYLAEALRHNAALRAADAAVDARSADATAAHARQWPNLDLNARYTVAHGGRAIEFPTGDLLNGVYATLNRFLEERGEAPIFPTIDNQRINFLREREQETKLSLTVPLFAPALWAAAAAADAQLDATRAAREAYARILVRETKRAYYGAMQAQAAVDILAASEALLAENVRVAQVLVATGKATRDRVLRAQAEYLAVVQRSAEARDQLAQARRVLNQLRGAPIDSDVLIQSAAAATLPAPLPILPRLRPELRQLEHGVAAAQAGERAARGQRLPQLAVVGDYGIQGTEYRFGAEDDYNTVSLVAQWRLWDFGASSAAQHAALAERVRLQAQHDDLETQLAVARQAAHDAHATSLAAVDTARARQTAAEEAFRIAERKRALGSLPQIEFLDAERALTEARLNLAIARCTTLDRAAEVELVNATYPLPAPLHASADILSAE